MNQINQLETFINQYRDYNEVEAEAYRINPFWRSGTWMRSLRRSFKIKAIHKEDKPNSPIIGYEPKNANFVAQKPFFNALESQVESLDDQLLEILRKTPVSWENQSKIKEIQSALKSSHKYLKEGLIRKYG